MNWRRPSCPAACGGSPWSCRRRTRDGRRNSGCGRGTVCRCCCRRGSGRWRPSSPRRNWRPCATSPLNFSRYASIETLRQGFLPVRGGFRVGLCGSAVVKDGEVTNLKQISSAVIRISREQKGIARSRWPLGLFRDGRFAQHPAAVTHREAARPRCCGIWCGNFPKGRASCPSGSPSSTSGEEIAVMSSGPASDGCRPPDGRSQTAVPRHWRSPWLLRGYESAGYRRGRDHRPRRICGPSRMAAGCGVALLATIHAANVEELQAKPFIRNCWPGGCSVRRC